MKIDVACWTKFALCLVTLGGELAFTQVTSIPIDRLIYPRFEIAGQELSGPLPTLNAQPAGSNGKYAVKLSWTASTSHDVVGYNIYRGTKSGGPYRKINSALDQSTNYTDRKVANGRTYYYVATAVNSRGQESAYSNQAKAVIP